MASAVPQVDHPPVDYMRLVCGDVPNLDEEFDRAGRALVRWPS